MNNKQNKFSTQIAGKTIAGFMCATMISTSVAGAAEPVVLGETPFVWDGYIEAEGSEVTSLLDFNSFSGILDAGGLPTPVNAENGKMYSANWTNHPANKDFWFDLNETDWSKVNNLNMKIYSEKATGADMVCIIYSPSPTSATGNYFRYNFKIDWEGWKTFSLKVGYISDFSKANTPKWTNVTQLRLVGHGNWGVVGNPETNLYISDISLDKEFKNDTFTFYGEDKINETFSLLEDSFAVYAGGSKVVTSGGAKPIGAVSGYVNGFVTLPLNTFADELGAKVVFEGDKFSIESNGNKISGAVGSSVFSLNGTNHNANVAPYAENDKIMIPGAQIAQLLGIPNNSDGRFLVVGSEKAVNAMRRIENLGVNEYSEIASYYSYRKDVDVKNITSADAKAVKDNWRRFLVGDETTNDMSDPDVKKAVDTITANARSAWNAMIKTPGSTELFEGIVSNESQDMEDAYALLESMARGYAVYGGELYKNEELKNDIMYGVEWMHKYRFGHVDDTGWKYTGMNNWADWRAAAPKYIGQILLYLEDEFSMNQIKTYLKYFDDNNYMPEYTAGNFLAHVEVIMLSALLQEDYERAFATMVALEKTYLYVDDNERITESQLRGEERKATTPMKGAGFFTDGSYILHTLHAMNGSYGIGHFNNLSQFEKLFTGTAFELNAPFRYNIPELFENALSSVIYGTTLFRHVMGRGDNPNNFSGGTQVMASGYSLSKLYSDEERNMMQSIIKTALRDNPTCYTGIINNLPIDEIKAFKEFAADDSIKPLDDLSDNHVFYNMDKIVHKTNDWAVGISMSSSRIFNYECINEQNKTGWYLGDGRTEYYLNGSNMNATTAYWASMDPYRMPGTTVDTQERKAVSVLQGNEYLSSKDFVGGVSLSGKYGTAAMDLESYHNETDFGVSSTGGGPNPAHKSDLVAKKAYFMFDDELVCLGTDINAKDNNDAEVLTIVDNLLNDKSLAVSPQSDLEAYKIKSAVASETPEPENVAANTIDSSMETKWAGENLAELVFDLGSEKELGFITFAFINGAKRQQKFELQTSADGEIWESVYDGASSGKKENNESFDLKKKLARYVKFINKGNSAGSSWVSVADAKIYPPAPDGTIGFADVEAYGTDVITSQNGVVNVMGEDVDISSEPWINIHGKCGYVFPTENTVNSGALKIRRTNNIQSHNEIWFSHGVNPTNQSYAYILLPGKSEEFTKLYSENRRTKILSNTSDLQAVKDEELGITGAVFWKNGSIEKITTDSPCILMYTETDGEFRISVSDPTQKLKSAQVIIDMPLKLNECDEMIVSSSDGARTVLNINFDNSCGRTMEAVYSK